MTEHMNSSVIGAQGDLHQNSSGTYSRTYSNPPDSSVVFSDIKTLVANTNLQFAIPVGVNSMQVMTETGKCVFFRVDVVATIPTGAAFVAEGMIPPSQSGEVRKLQEAKFTTGHTMNLICEAAGKVYVEFLYL